MLTSYCDPIYTDEGDFIGVITTDISLNWLSKVITQDMPYENSYCIMLGQEGHIFVHPDSTRLVHKTIFDDADPLTQPDIIAMGHEMMSQKKGYMQVDLDGEVCYVFYQPMVQTGWSIALVCKESDIFRRYNRLAFVLFPLLTAGLVLMFVLCRKIVAIFIKPLGHLERETRWIADGNFNFSLPHSNRSDVVGRLQNSFLAMQQSLSQHIRHLEDMNVEAELHNTELARANKIAEEATKRQTAFLQDILHQIRTPLNIMMGFVQVLRDDYTIIPKEEMVEIVHTLQHNASTITRIVDMLMASSAIDGRKTIELDDDVTCIGVVTEAEKIFNERLPHMSDLQVETLVDDSLTVLTHKDYLMKILNELLYNAKKFTTNGWVKLKVQDNGDAVLFSVEDKGPGIAESYRQQIFTQFSKFNTFSEGLGLGLSISKQFAHLLGGDLWLDTDYKLGARFVLEIPLNR
jgi:signal transduction histidine kinase